ncbi:MAG: PAS domain S-box protein, partial [Acidobacteriales bacterium]|nr:PAS domain S-box protein [Terriglobales bacterium]
KFVEDTHERTFRGVPIIYWLPLESAPGTRALDSDFTGVENEVAPAETLDTALQLMPSKKQVVVVGGTSAFDRQLIAIIQEKLKVHEDRVAISYLTDLTMPALLDRLKHLPSDSIALLSSISQDAAGTKFIGGSESSPMVANAANVPVFTLYDANFNHGEVGGKLSNVVENGKILGRMAIRMLNGERPMDIPKVKGATTYMFDGRALNRWGLAEENLPPGSIVLNRQLTVWESYKWYIITGISVILVQAMLIAGLIWHRARRRKAEAELATALKIAQESEVRFRLVANSAPVMIWMSGLDKLCYYFNQRWLDFTGRPLEAEVGNGWLEGVYPEDTKLCLETYTQSFDRREPFSMQYRVRRSDGEYRWVLDVGVPRFNSDGSFAGYIGSAIDVTERKHAEEALSSVSRRLIQAQEKERMRIARELHDDINQRIAMLAVEVGRLRHTPPDSRRELEQSLNAVQGRLAEISTELQAISHRLHSSKLDYLGLAAACKSFCTEFAERQSVTIDFAAEGIPEAVPQEVSICLFRVLQESLTNAFKHSRAERIEVRLHGVVGEIQLSIRDYGVGFDVNGAMNGRGLGLISMRERVSLVNGAMLIASKPMGGTKISVRVPTVVLNEAKHMTPGAA